MLKSSLALLCLALFGAAAAPPQSEPPNESRGVHFVLGTQQISPTTTFELRFEQQMVPPQKVGLVAADSPLVITPGVSG